MINTCICCGEIIPEGMIACPNCLVVSKKKTEKTVEQLNAEFDSRVIRKGTLITPETETACLICGDGVPTTFGDFSPKICKKCRDAVMKVREQDV